MTKDVTANWVDVGRLIESRNLQASFVPFETRTKLRSCEAIEKDV